VANGLSERNLYVRSVRLNGKPYGARVLKYADIMRGGELAFEMGDSAR
jgi:putative alpha-1,2-mannosidase